MSSKSGSLVLMACILALSTFPLFAEDAEKAYTLTTSTSFGMLYGQASEYVYDQNVSTDYKVSELTWPFEPLFYAGAGLDLTTKIGLFADLSLRQGLSGKTGTMTDSDYLNGDGVRTLFSESDCYTERATLLDFKVGYNVPFFSAPLAIGAFCGFSYMDFKWSARDGYTQYPTGGGHGYGWDSNGNFVPGTYAPWSAGITQTPLYGTGILYEETYLLGLFGLRASYKLGDALTLGAACSIAPLAYCYTEDNHELRVLDFYSRLSGGFMFEPSLSAEYKLKSGASLRLDVAYRQVTGLKGDITQVDQGATSTSSEGNYYAGPDSTSTSTGGSGAFISMLDASLSFKLAF